MPNRAESGQSCSGVYHQREPSLHLYTHHEPVSKVNNLPSPDCRKVVEIWRHDINSRANESDSPRQTEEGTGESLKRVRRREATFLNSPQEVRERKRALALAGFYYSGRGDVVKCAFCCGEVHAGKLSECATESHAKIFPKCRYIRQQMSGKVSQEAAPETASGCGDRLKHLKETVANLKSENARLHRLTICAVCCTEPVQTLMLPCRHLVSCNKCATSVNNCPKCEKPIERKVKTFVA